MPRVLIIKPSSLGDIIHGLQAAQSLRAQIPEVEIDWVASSVFAPLVRACEEVSKVHVFDRKGSVPAFLRLAGEIREQEYDWALDLQGLARSAALLAMARAKRKAGRSDAREGARWLYRQKIPLPPGGRHAHALEILLQFLPLLGARAELSGQPLEFHLPEATDFPSAVMDCSPVVMFPDSRRKEKEWPGFYELTARVLKEFPQLSIIWAGSSGPEPDLNWPENRFFNLIGRTPLDSLPVLISAARLVVCNDSGPMHLAAALQRPIVTLFGPTDDGRYGPYPVENPRHAVIRAPGGKLRDLSAEVVLLVVKQVLKPA